MNNNKKLEAVSFEKGTVKLEEKQNQKYGDSPFQLVFASDNYSGWGITKDVTADEAKSMTYDTAEIFYFQSLDFLGLV